MANLMSMCCKGEARVCMTRGCQVQASERYLEATEKPIPKALVQLLERGQHGARKVQDNG